MGQTVKRLFSIIRCVISKLFPQHFSLTKSIFSNFPALAVSERQGPLQFRKMTSADWFKICQTDRRHPVRAPNVFNFVFLRSQFLPLLAPSKIYHCL